MTNLRDAILGAPLKRVTVEVDGIGEVGIREMTAAERDAWEAEILERRGDDVEVNLEGIRVKLLVKVLVDPESGERLFADEDVELLGGISGAVAGDLFAAAQKLNGLTREDVEELAGN